MVTRRKPGTAKKVTTVAQTGVLDKPAKLVAGQTRKVGTNAGLGHAPQVDMVALKAEVEDMRAFMEARAPYRRYAEQSEVPKGERPFMHGSLLPTTCVIAVDTEDGVEFDGFVSFAGASVDQKQGRFAIAWDICGKCVKHVLNCTCPAGSFPRDSVVEIVRQMSDPNWSHSKGPSVTAMGFQHDPDNLGATFGMIFESPAKPWKGRPGTKPGPVRRKPVAATSGAVPTPSPVIPAGPKRRVVKRQP